MLEFLSSVNFLAAFYKLQFKGFRRFLGDYLERVAKHVAAHFLSTHYFDNASKYDDMYHLVAS